MLPVQYIILHIVAIPSLTLSLKGDRLLYTQISVSLVVICS